MFLCFACKWANKSTQDEQGPQKQLARVPALVASGARSEFPVRSAHGDINEQSKVSLYIALVVTNRRASARLPSPGAADHSDHDSTCRLC